jgi:hypothetical protein
MFNYRMFTAGGLPKLVNLSDIFTVQNAFFILFQQKIIYRIFNEAKTIVINIFIY